jgi:hypothetical protein
MIGLKDRLPSVAMDMPVNASRRLIEPQSTGFAELRALAPYARLWFILIIGVCLARIFVSGKDGLPKQLENSFR